MREQLEVAATREGLIMPKSHTIYIRTANGVSGVEILETQKEGKTGKAGRVGLRFFATSKKGFFCLEPSEAYKLACFIEAAVTAVKEGRSDKKKLPPHKTGGSEGKGPVASVTVEAWSRNGKGGVSLLYAKEDSMFNIALGQPEDSLFVAAFLKKLSVDAAWFEGKYDAMAEGDRVYDEPMSDLPDSYPPPRPGGSNTGAGNNQKNPQQGAGNQPRNQSQGSGGKQGPAVTQQEINALRKLIADSRTDQQALMNYYKVKDLKDMTREQYAEAQKNLIAKINKQKEEKQRDSLTMIEKPGCISCREQETLSQMVDKTKTDKIAFLSFYKAGGFSDFTPQQYDHAIDALIRKNEKMARQQRGNA